MAKTTHASVQTMQIASLLSELELKCDDAMRCQEIIARAASVDPKEKVSLEVVNFVKAYVPDIELYSAEEGFLDTAGDLLKRAFEAILKAIAWIIEKLRDLFKYIFDSQFRSRKEILDVQRRLITLSTDAGLVSKFEVTNCSVVTQKDVSDIIYKSQELVGLLTSVSHLTRNEHIDVLIKDFCSRAGTSYADQKLSDAMANAVPARNTTFGSAGWTVNVVLTTIGQYLAMLNGIDTLKQTKVNLETEIADLKARVNKAASDPKCNQAEVIEMQRETSAKVMGVKLITYAVAILARRSDNVLAFFIALEREMHKLSVGKK